MDRPLARAAGGPGPRPGGAHAAPRRLLLRLRGALQRVPRISAGQRAIAVRGSATGGVCHAVRPLVAAQKRLRPVRPAAPAETAGSGAQGSAESRSITRLPRSEE